MNILYDENGDFKLGTIISEQEGSLQIEAQHGKRAKLKSSHVLLRFAEPPLASLMAAATALKEQIDPSFLWEACGDEEFGFAELGREYFGAATGPAELTAVLLRLHESPAYFHRKGRGRYRRAPAQILQAALAGLDRKRQQQAQMAQWVAELEAGTLPEALRSLMPGLLYRPDRNRPETKALEQACHEAGLSAPKLLERCGALPSSHAYHFGRFVFEFFPSGTAFPRELPFAVPEGLPVAEVAAFSLDDADTTEIDDAFSIVMLANGLMRVGVHIAAPALGFEADSKVGQVARQRLSTIYTPATKITMLPPALISAFSLEQGGARPAVSLYVDIDPQTQAVRNTHSRIEAVPIAANLRHQDLQAINPVLAAGGDVSGFAYGDELATLYRLAGALGVARGDEGRSFERAEYVFHVEQDRVSVSPRARGAPLDKLVAELMILVNATWGRLLADHGVAAIYRAQAQGKVRMTTVPSPHEGLGVAHYAWSSSPLRRYVDLINQWQLIALLEGTMPPFERNSATLLGAIRDFELSYGAFGEFQDRMERYWCLRWLVQEQVQRTQGTVVRDNTVKFRDLPLYVRMPSLPAELAPGTQVSVEITAIDLIDSTIEAIYKSPEERTALPA
jgi:exoribonuclease II